MKKQLILILYCLALVVSGMAQPKTEKIPEKITEKLKHEKFTKRINLEKEKSDFFQKQTYLSKVQNQTKFPKGTDWWDPDTITLYSDSETKYKRILFSYENGNCITEAYQKMNDAGQWINNEKYTYTYDAHNNLKEILYQEWEANKWINGTKINYSYDENNNAYFGYFQRWFDGAWADGWAGDLSIFYNNMQSEHWIFGNKFTVSYVKTGEVSISEIVMENAIKIYPNPVSNILHIETNNPNTLPEINIYSIQGVLLMQAKGNQIDISSLQSGIYIANVDGVCRKIVKQ